MNLDRQNAQTRANSAQHARSSTLANTMGALAADCRLDRPSLRPGYCQATMDGDAGDCDRGDQGSVPLTAQEAKSWPLARRRCRSRCARCARCNFISLSLTFRECSWFAACDLSQLRQDVDGFRSLAVPAAAHRQRQ